MFEKNEYSIRPIESQDKDLILQWRNSDRVRNNMYSDHLISQPEHDAWFARALNDDSANFLIFSYMGRRIGFASFTNVSKFHERCYWAFYLGEVDVPRGCGSVMEFFAIDYAFSVLKIRKLCCEVFCFNSGVIKLHEKFGFKQEGHFVEHYKKQDKYEDIVCLAKFSASWQEDKTTFNKRLFGI